MSPIILPMNRHDISFQTETLQAAQIVTDDAMRNELEEVVREILQLFVAKGSDYNAMFTFAENMCHGDFSWSTLCTIKAHRAASLLLKYNNNEQPNFDQLDDVIKDLAVYSLNWLAWRRLRTKDYPIV